MYKLTPLVTLTSNYIYAQPCTDSYDMPVTSVSHAPSICYFLLCFVCIYAYIYVRIYMFVYIFMHEQSQKSIRDNNKGLPVARHFYNPDHSICDLGCDILKGYFSNNTDKLMEEQILIRKFKTDTHGPNQDLVFLTPYTYFHK